MAGKRFVVCAAFVQRNKGVELVTAETSTGLASIDLFLVKQQGFHHTGVQP